MNRQRHGGPPRIRAFRAGRRVGSVLLCISVLATLMVLTGSGAGAQPTAGTDEAAVAAALESAVPTDRMIVRYRAGAGLDTAALSANAKAPVSAVRRLDDGAWVVELPERLGGVAAEAVATEIEHDPNVLYAEPDTIMFPTLAPNDPHYVNQWHYKAVSSGNYGANLPGAWDLTTGSSDIVVAVVDTGKRDHVDLADRFVAGYDFIDDIPTANDGNLRDSNPDDPGDWVTSAERNTAGGPFEGCPVSASSWHGTHVAGTIGAKSNNGVGVAGVDWNAKILPVRVLGKCGGYTSDIADGMRWAAGLAVSGVPANANPADVINLSLGGPGSCGSTFQNAINAANGAGAHVVIAAGNDNANASGYSPGNCNGVITVASTSRLGNRATYSNYGATIEIAAPGAQASQDGGVLSTLNTGTTTPGSDNYVGYQGTSMAAPHVAGVISLMLARDPSLTQAEVLSLLQANVTPFPLGSTCSTSICGPGILNAAGAVAAAGPVDPPPDDVGGRFFGVTPKRLLDSRTGTGGFSTPWGSATTRQVKVTGGTTGIPDNATAVVLNTTVTEPTAVSFLTVFPTGVLQPLASNLNYTPGQTIPNLVKVKVGTNGNVSMYNNLGSVHVIADVVGYFVDDSEVPIATDGGFYTGLTPKRLLDSRDGTGGFSTPWGSGTTRNLQVAGGSTGVPSDATAVILNVTATGPTANSFLTAWPKGEARPLASNLNYGPGQTIPNLVVVKVGADNAVSLYNNLGSVHVIADVVGYYRPEGTSGGFTGVAPKRLLDSRSAFQVGPFSTPWGSGQTRNLTVVGGTTTVPADATAVVLNVTVTAPTVDSYLTVWPTGVARPLASNLNYSSGLTIPNLVVVKVGTGGQVSFYNNLGAAHVIADVVGYYT